MGRGGEREGETRMEFMTTNVTRERELASKVIRMDFCGSKCY
jgi:hypothetical protein